MGELFAYIKNRDFKGLMILPSDNLFIQMFRYLFVGGFAFLADFGSLFLFVQVLGINDYLSTALAFVIGLIVNYILSKLLVFTKAAKVRSAFEFISYGIIGVIGLGMTEGIIYLGTELLDFHVLLCKLVATAIVLVWNFTARKIFLYGGKK